VIIELAEAHARRVDNDAPGLLIGLHITGSSALDDYVPGVSDLDLVGVLSREPTEDDLAALAKAHIGSDADAVYLLPQDLAGPAEDAALRPWGRDGEFNTTEPANVTPVLWDQLNRYSITVRGDRPQAAVTPQDVEAYCRANLVEYWQPTVAEVAEALVGRDLDAPLSTEVVLWVGLGPARLWHTIHTGEIVGKTRAVELAADRWPDLAPPLRALVVARHG
jgi:streptomycin 3"-adenylyltransferase